MTDQQQIRAVAERYFHALDSRDFHLAESCFTDDAIYSTYDGATTEVGREAILASLRRIEAFAHSMHILASQYADVDGDNARARTIAMAILVDADVVDPVHVRGLTYHDDLVRSTEGWRITHRRHSAHWQFDAAAVPVLFAGVAHASRESGARGDQ
jgi:uncharacterized protein (TIGR02246 family)